LQGGKDLRECFGGAFWEPKERDAMHPDKRARRFSIVVGLQLESGFGVAIN
jgi:hypothetical protein